MKTLAEFHQIFYQEKGKRQLLLSQLEKQQTQFNESILLGAAIEKAQAFIQTVAKETQEQLKYHIEDIVQLALDTCFPNEYEFQVEFEIKRGRTEANLRFLKEGQPVSPIDASGGGVVDLAAFALRIAAWTLSHDDNIIIMDEPFRFLSRDLQPKAGLIMKELSNRLQLQFLMVTHNPDIIDVADRVFEVSLQNGKSIVEVQ